MSVSRRSVRSATFVSALLVTTAMAAPAFAQIEEVVVTAQKTSQDVQSVPIAMSALSARDLEAKQVNQFKDLQFSTPNVSYSKGNFTGSDFQIRGIGQTGVGYDSEAGVAINVDDVFLAQPPLADASFYDLDRIEVLRGPQSTLYGRGATGGVVSVVSAKPDTSGFFGNLEASYGNYDAKELKGFLNVPIITDQLALRIAGDWVRHSGYTTNIQNGDHIDDRSMYSVRSSLRWTPSANTTIDLVGSFTKEDDRKMRSQKQYCHSDPTGTLGCLPDRLANEPVNINSNLSVITSSIQGMQAAFAGTALAPAASCPGGYGPPCLGLFDLTTPPTLPAGYSVPTDPRQIATDFDPSYRAQDNFMAAEWKQSWTSWLNSTLVLGADHNTTLSRESFNNVPAPPIDPVHLAIAEGTFMSIVSNPAYGGSPALAAQYAPFFAVPGALPTSGIGNLGITGGNIDGFSNSVTATDQSNGSSSQYSAELNFKTSFDGPLNFMLAGYYLHTHYSGNYYILSNTLDYAGIFLGGLGSLGAPTLCPNGCIYAPSYYDNDGISDTLTSKSIYGEVYYDLIPDELKLTGGLRYTEDNKGQKVRVALLSGLVPLGTTSEDQAIANLANEGLVDYDPTVPGNQPYQVQNVVFRKWTGRAVLDWTPKLDFTDSTLVYGSYARGYKAGGFNPGVQPGNGVPASYGPETIDAFEVGTKNTLPVLDGALQANGDVWYYDYKGLQVSKIVGNTSVNENIDAKLWGVEGQFVWAPSDEWQFSLNIAHTDTNIGNSYIVDPRNPTAGNPNTLLVKDATPSSTGGSNCVLYYTNPAMAAAGVLPVMPAGTPLPPFFAAPGGVKALSGVGIANTAYGSCINPATPLGGGLTYGDLLASEGFATSNPAIHGTYEGVAKDLSGNNLQNTPDFTIGIGAQNTMAVMGDYHLVTQVNYYWQSSMFGRIFNDSSDKIGAWGMLNAQVTLNAPDSAWYVRAYVKNALDSDNLTGMYLTSASTGLYTNAFYGDPRTYGITIGTNF